MNDLTKLFFELQKPDAHVLVVTGAGISVASGIAPFRGSDPDAVWNKDVLDKGTFDYFNHSPVESWEWYLSRFDKARSAKPNAAHTALVEIERKLVASGKKFMLCTQNVDGLHLDAGTKNLVEIHGAARKMRCESRFASCKYGAPDGFLEWDEKAFEGFREDPCLETMPYCPSCKKRLRAHVLWFDEGYSDHEDYGLDRLFAIESQFTCVIYTGTSFSVNITDLIMTTAFQYDRPQFIIDPYLKPPGDVVHFKESSETFFPALAAKL